MEDCGTVINPQLVDEQIRGGIVQGIGGALFEQCLYDEARPDCSTAIMMDYLVPMAAEMPDIDIGHVVTPTADSELGAKGAGEAGTAGAPACVMNAINDALRPLGAAPIIDDADHAGAGAGGAAGALIFSRHSGAPRSGEPGIHNHRSANMDSGLLASRRPETLILQSNLLRSTRNYTLFPWRFVAHHVSYVPVDGPGGHR